MSEKLEKHLLEKMLRKRIIGGKHITYENILSSIPRHEIGNLKDAIHELLKKEFLVWYDRSRRAIQLNLDKLNEIKKYLADD